METRDSSSKMTGKLGLKHRKCWKNVEQCSIGLEWMGLRENVQEIHGILPQVGGWTFSHPIFG